MEKFVKILKKIKIKNIVILILLIVFNTYAWFIYATKVSSQITVHISSWNVQFSVGEDETVTNIVIAVDRIYPGMETVEKNVTVTNKGEIKAKLSYNIMSLTVLDEYYKVGENITAEELLNKINTEYPFKINIFKDDSQLLDGTGEGTFKVTVEWPFESGNDELDTEWGNKAYDYYTQNVDTKSVEIELMLIAQQIGE